MLRIPGIADLCVAIDFHNYEPVPRIGPRSVNQMPVTLTALGALVRQAKYENDAGALATLVVNIVNAAEKLRPFHCVHYVPHSNPARNMTQVFADAITRKFFLPPSEPAYDASCFPHFSKSMDARNIENLVRCSGILNTTERAGLSSLIIDDTLRSGATLFLAASAVRRRYGYAETKALCITKVRTTV